MRFRSSSLLLAACVAAAAAGTTASARAALLPGNLVVVEVTNAGTANQNDSAQLQQFTTAGATVGAPIVLQTATGTPLVLPDLSDHDGQLSLSADGNVLTLGAYISTPNAAAANTVSASAAPRVITVVNPDGSLNTSTQLTGAGDYNSVSLRQVTSIDGTQFWTSGNGAKPFGSGTADIGGLRYTTLGASTTTSLNPGGGLDIRSTTILNGQLYGASGSSNNPTGSHSVFLLGTGLPITGAVSFTALPKTGAGIISGNQSPSFTTLADGDLLLYTSDSTAGGLDKFIFSPATQTWTPEGTVALSGIEDLATSVTGNTVTLFASTQSGIFSLTDSTDSGNIGPAGSNLSFGSALISAAAGTEFRGLSFAPTAVPEPASLSILAIAGTALMIRRRSVR